MMRPASKRKPKRWLNRHADQSKRALEAAADSAAPSNPNRGSNIRFKGTFNARPNASETLTSRAFSVHSRYVCKIIDRPNQVQ